MEPLALTVRLRLVATAENGRQSPILSNYRPTFDLGNRWHGEPVLNDGRITLLDAESLAGFDLYWEVFDPQYDHEDHEPVVGSLSDDVLDVYRDIRGGLWSWEKNEPANAIWEWRFSFDAHWGDHAARWMRFVRSIARADEVRREPESHPRQVELPAAEP